MRDSTIDRDGITLTIVDRAATITVNAPQRDNRFTVAQMRAFIAALGEAQASDASVLLLRSGAADFTLGRDQSETGTGLTRLESLGLILEANSLLREFGGVSVCEVRGRAFGFGAGIAVQSDVTICSDDATFSFDEINYQLAPLVVADYLPRLTSPKTAAYMLFSGDVLPAEDAHTHGIVTRVVRRTELEQHTLALRDTFADKHAGAVRMIKRYLLDAVAGTMDDPAAEGIARLDAWIGSGRPDSVG